jgi:hypothetical protein
VKRQATFHFALDRLLAETSADVTVKVKVALEQATKVQR